MLISACFLSFPVLSGGFCYVMRNTVSFSMAGILQFILLGWVASSWGLFWPVFIPEKSVVMVTAFHQIFLGLLLSGYLPPVTYEDIYSKSGIGIISGLLSPSRFFMESLMVNEYRSTPLQHGHTINFEESMNATFYEDFRTRTKFFDAFSYRGLAENDSSVTVRTNMGWYWGVLPSIFVGLAIRFLALILVSETTTLHLYSRNTTCIIIHNLGCDNSIASHVLSFETVKEAHRTTNPK